jgi:hypothetical protein
MSSFIQFHDVTCVTGATSIPVRYVDKYDQLMIKVPGVTGVFSSSPVGITLNATPAVTTAQAQMHYYDYVNKAPATCCITVSTAGIYEMPYPGAQQYVSFNFDTPISNITNFQIIVPKTTY